MPQEKSFDFDLNPPDTSFGQINSLEDLDTVRNTLQLLDEMRVSAYSSEELKTDVCKEIYYSAKDVKR